MPSTHHTMLNMSSFTKHPKKSYFFANYLMTSNFLHPHLPLYIVTTMQPANSLRIKNGTKRFAILHILQHYMRPHLLWQTQSLPCTFLEQHCRYPYQTPKTLKLSASLALSWALFPIWHVRRSSLREAHFPCKDEQIRRSTMSKVPYYIDIFFLHRYEYLLSHLLHYASTSVFHCIIKYHWGGVLIDII